jgi:hypothetical protein
MVVMLVIYMMLVYGDDVGDDSDGSVVCVDVSDDVGDGDDTVDGDD